MADETSIKSITSKDPMMFNSLTELIVEIESSLSNLRILALKTNFAVPAERQNYLDNVAFLKRFYVRAERLVRNDVNS